MKRLTCIFFALFSLLASIQGFAQDEDGYPLPFLEHWNTGTLEQWKGETVKIPLKGLAPGLYLVRVETGGEMVVRKVVIRR